MTANREGVVAEYRAWLKEYGYHHSEVDAEDDGLVQRMAGLLDAKDEKFEEAGRRAFEACATLHGRLERKQARIVELEETLRSLLAKGRTIHPPGLTPQTVGMEGSYQRTDIDHALWEGLRQLLAGSSSELEAEDEENSLKPSRKVRKPDTRPPMGGWAPGNYIRTCARCGDHFAGDKRAFLCADCVYGVAQKLEVEDEEW